MGTRIAGVRDRGLHTCRLLATYRVIQLGAPVTNGIDCETTVPVSADFEAHTLDGGTLEVVAPFDTLATLVTVTDGLRMGVDLGRNELSPRGANCAPPRLRVEVLGRARERLPTDLWAWACRVVDLKTDHRTIISEM